MALGGIPVQSILRIHAACLSGTSSHHAACSLQGPKPVNDLGSCQTIHGSLMRGKSRTESKGLRAQRHARLSTSFAVSSPLSLLHPYFGFPASDVGLMRSVSSMCFEVHVPLSPQTSHYRNVFCFLCRSRRVRKIVLFAGRAPPLPSCPPGSPFPAIPDSPAPASIPVPHSEFGDNGIAAGSTSTGNLTVYRLSVFTQPIAITRSHR